MTYEQLDTIADCYVPALWLLCFTVLLKTKIRHQQARQNLDFILLPLIVYGCMLIDRHVSLWPKFGLDYSTHTAAALAGCSFLWHQRKLRTPLSISLLAYFALMIYQGYHSWLDIFTTSAAILLFITAARLIVNKFEK